MDGVFYRRDIAAGDYHEISKIVPQGEEVVAHEVAIKQMTPPSGITDHYVRSVESESVFCFHIVKAGVISSCLVAFCCLDVVRMLLMDVDGCSINCVPLCHS